MKACYRLSVCFYIISVFFIHVSPVDARNFAVTTDESAFDLHDLSEAKEPLVDLGPKIIVNIAARRLFLYDQDKLIKSYPVAVGSNTYKTPAGMREMTQIVWNPWWNPPDSAWAADEKDTPPGPHNPLGPVKMKLGSGIMIHGTNKPNSVGKAASHGCMRMYSQDAVELAQWIQMHVTDQNRPEIFEKYSLNSRRSFYVQLEQPVPVEIVYDLVDVQDDKLLVYSDIYYRGKNNIQSIQEELENSGYDLEKFDWEYLKQQIKLAKNTDIVLPVADLFLKNREVL